MKILFTSYPFYPHIAGIETVSMLLAHEFVRRGHEVKVVTATPNPAPDDFPFEVVRRPGPLSLSHCVRWCDVLLQNGHSLRLAYPLLASRRPWVVVLVGMFEVVGSQGWRARVKRRCLRYSHAIAISGPVARQARAHVGGVMEIIPNPYDDSLFRRTNDGVRPIDLVFLGRLVSYKGTHVLLDALARLRDRRLRPRLDIIGAGPEEVRLREQCLELGLEDRVRLLGPMVGQSLVEALNQARIMVVPTVLYEGFGVVALEGMACGCVIVGTERGGLKEAIGPGGVTVPNGDPVALAETLADLLTEPARLEPYRRDAAEHLARHRVGATVDRYLEFIRQIHG